MKEQSSDGRLIDLGWFKDIQKASATLACEEAPQDTAK